MWTKSRVRYIYVPVRVVFKCICLLTRLPTGSVLVWPKLLFDTYICVCYIYMLSLFFYPTPLAKTGSVIVWTKSRVRHIYISVYVVLKYICLLNSTYRQGVCLRGQSRYLIRIYVSNVYMYCHYLSTQLHLPPGSQMRGQCRVLDIHMFLYVLSLSILVYSTSLADRECACVGKVAI